jgi:hypothetical protein
MICTHVVSSFRRAGSVLVRQIQDEIGSQMDTSGREWSGNGINAIEGVPTMHWKTMRDIWTSELLSSEQSACWKAAFLVSDLLVSRGGTAARFPAFLLFFGPGEVNASV